MEEELNQAVKEMKAELTEITSVLKDIANSLRILSAQMVKYH